MPAGRGRKPWAAHKFVVAVTAAGAVSASSARAGAWCRTTTCDPTSEKQQCMLEPGTGCMITGMPLYWRGRCISFGVDHRGSPKRGIDHETARTVIWSAYRSWLDTDCAGQPPSLELSDSPAPIRCDHQEYNQDDGNANAWIFLDDAWPYEGRGHQLALTTLTFNVDNGEIFDVDVEINSFQFTITVGDDAVQADLQSVATHEAGHFFGLSHSNVQGATMRPQYSEGDSSLRSLEADDVEGICALYPADREVAACQSTSVPRHGFSADCGAPPEEDSGCRTTRPGGPSPGAPHALGMLVFGALLFRARRAFSTRPRS